MKLNKFLHDIQWRPWRNLGERNQVRHSTNLTEVGSGWRILQLLERKV